jgi:hypothetical protein
VGAHCFFPSVADPEAAQLLACKRAKSLSGELGVTRLILETDNTSAAANQSSGMKGRSVHRPLVEEINECLGKFEDHTVMAIRRMANEVAHRLAKESCLIVVLPFGVMYNLLGVVNLLASDCNNGD